MKRLICAELHPDYYDSEEAKPLMKWITAIALLLSGCTVMASADSAFANVLADSVADFGGTQGSNGWYYGYYDKTADTNPGFHLNDFTAMSQYLPQSELTDWVNGPAWAAHAGTLFTELWSNGGHGNGLVTSGGRMSEEQFADRRWVSEYDGAVTISGQLAKLDGIHNSNGIAGRIYLNGDEAFSQFIAGADTVGIVYTLNTTIHLGDILDFQLDPWAANDLGDSSLFTARISTVPEPASFSLVILAATGYCLRRRHRS